MDGDTLGNLVIICLILASFMFNYLKSQSLMHYRVELFERIEVLDEGMKIIGMFLEKIPDMQPNFQINQNPLSQIMEFIINARNENAAINEEPNPILADTPIRDVQGRFTDGTEEQQEEIEL